MKLLCEVMVSEILPSVRALIAKDLMETYGLNQVQISNKLGITQPAVSQYMREIRGHKVKIMESNKELMFSIKNISQKIASDELKSMETHVFCTICKEIRRNDEKLVKLLECDI